MEKQLQPKAAFNLKEIVFEKVSFQSDLFDANEPIKISLSAKGHLYAGESMAVVSLSVNLISENQTEENAFISLFVRSTFQMQNVSSLNEIPHFFYANAVAIVFPYVRAFVTNITTQAGFAAIIIPILKLTQIGDELSHNFSLAD